MNFRKLAWRVIKIGAMGFVGLIVLAAIFGESSQKTEMAQAASASAESDAGSQAVSKISAAEKAAMDEDARLAQLNPATESLPTADRRETRYGVIEAVRKGEGEVALTFQGHSDDETHYALGLGPVYRFGENDLLLLEMQSGGVACPVVYKLLVVSASGVNGSKSFGSCSDIEGIRVTRRPDKLVVRVGNEAYFADATGVDQVRVKQAHDEEHESEIDHASTNVQNLARPLLEPDWKYYRWCGRLVEADLSHPKAGMFLVSWGNYNFIGLSANEEKNDEYRKMPIRIGGNICITGVYMANQKGETVLGTPRTVPVLAVHRLRI